MVYGYKSEDQQWKNTKPDKYILHSDVPFGSIYQTFGKKQYLCVDESPKIGHTLSDVVNTLNTYDHDAPKILIIISCAIGTIDIREFSTPVSNVNEMIKQYIQHITKCKIVQKGGETFIKRGKKWYKAQILDGKLRLTEKN